MQPDNVQNGPLNEEEQYTFERSKIPDLSLGTILFIFHSIAVFALIDSFHEHQEDFEAKKAAQKEKIKREFNNRTKGEIKVQAKKIKTKSRAKKRKEIKRELCFLTFCIYMFAHHNVYNPTFYVYTPPKV